MLAKITAPDLSQETTESELLIERHKEYKSEIDSRLPVFNSFYEHGQTFIKDGHYLSQEIEDKIKILQQRVQLLESIWNKRDIIYKQNLDVQLFKREASVLENWLTVRERTLQDSKLGENILQVEELIRKHRDFEEAVKAQEDKFNALKRMTMIEEAFAQQKKQEAIARKAEKDRLEQERLEQRKRMEVTRIADLRRQEEREPKYITEEQQSDSVPSYPYSNVSESPVPVVSIRKTNSIAHIFERDRVRRGSTDTLVKRAESMKVGPASKPVKRTPSFTTRRRNSLRQKNAGSPIFLSIQY